MTTRLLEFSSRAQKFTAVSIMLSINSFVTQWNPNLQDIAVARSPGIRRQFTQFIRIFPSAEHKVSEERKKVTRRAGISDMNTNHLMQTSMTHIKCFLNYVKVLTVSAETSREKKTQSFHSQLYVKQWCSSRTAKSDQWEQKSFVSLAAQNLIWIRKWTLKFDW